MKSPALFPAIVSGDNTSTRALIADDVMTFGHYDAAVIARKQRKLCFTLAYFLIFGMAPRV
jgi:hypothetical protein